MFWIQIHEFIISFQNDEPSEIDLYIELKWHKNPNGENKLIFEHLCIIIGDCIVLSDINIFQKGEKNAEKRVVIEVCIFRCVSFIWYSLSKANLNNLPRALETYSFQFCLHSVNTHASG